jgi:hypothetical protein
VGYDKACYGRQAPCCRGIVCLHLEGRRASQTEKTSDTQNRRAGLVLWVNPRKSSHINREGNQWSQKRQFVNGRKRRTSKRGMKQREGRECRKKAMPIKVFNGL